MKRFLFFAYREWAINIFNNVRDENDEYILVTNKNLCNLEFIDSIKPDVIFLYGWSWYVKKEITDKYLCLCLHPSPLPKYRGGSPIQNQIMGGETKSAVTIFKMGEGIDDGDIAFQSEIDLSGYISSIFKEIEEVGTIDTKFFIYHFKTDPHSYEPNGIGWKKQNESEATIYKRLKPTNSEIKPEDFLNNDALYFYNKVRGLQNPYPEAFIMCKTGKLILEKVRYEK